jgi:flagellar motor switch protein FliM
VTGNGPLQEPEGRPEARAIEKMIRVRAERQGRPFSLEPVLERLALGLWRSVRRLAGADGRVALQTTFARPFPEYRGEIAAGSLMSMFEIGDASGSGLLVLDSRLTDAAIEVLLGGGQLPAAPETETAAARAYTPADQAVVRGLVRLIVAELSRTLAGPGSSARGLTGRLLQTETDPQLVTMGSADGVVTVARFEAVLGPGGCGGTFDLVLPDSFIESVVRTPPQPGSGESRELIPPQGRLGSISEVSFELHAVLDRIRIPLSDLSRWEAGTWLPLATEAEQPVTVYCEREDRCGLGPALFTGRLGSSRGRRAVRIADVVNAPSPAHDRQKGAST